MIPHLPHPHTFLWRQNHFCSSLINEGTVKIRVVEVVVTIELEFYLPLCFIFCSIV